MSTAVLVAFGPESPEFTFPVSGTLRGRGFYIPLANLVVLSVCVLAIAAVYLLMFRTDFGRALRAPSEISPGQDYAGGAGARTEAAV